jgi:Transposase, Mutator family
MFISFLRASHNGGLHKEDTLMKQDSAWRVTCRGKEAVEAVAKSLNDVLKEGAQRMLQTAIEAEVQDYLSRHAGQCEPATGHRVAVRNGRLPEREILSPLGPIRVEQPRVRTRGEGMKFSSAILPPYLRRAPSLDALIPALYLKGISTNDFPEALAAILGEGARGSSADTPPTSGPACWWSWAPWKTARRNWSPCLRAARKQA